MLQAVQDFRKSALHKHIQELWDEKIIQLAIVSTSMIPASIAETISREQLFGKQAQLLENKDFFKQLEEDLQTKINEQL